MTLSDGMGLGGNWLLVIGWWCFDDGLTVGVVVCIVHASFQHGQSVGDQARGAIPCSVKRSPQLGKLQ